MTRIYSTKNTIFKITWILASLVFLSLGLYLTYNSIKDYVEYHVITNTRRVLELPVIFPAVTLCGQNLTLSDINFNASFFRTSQLSPTDFEEMSDVEIFVTSPLIHTCIRFNGYRNDSVKLKTVTSTDFETNSLYLYFKHVTGEIVTFVTSNDLNSYSTISPVGLFPGKLQNLYVSLTIDKRLPEPFNRCLNESESYHKENCVEQCIQTQISASYNCTLTGYYQDKKLDICSDKSYYNKANLECEAECKEGCVSKSYFVTTTEDLPVNNSSLQVWVLFSNLKFTEITQIPKMTLFDLIGSIGGTLGVFVGFQILSIIEIFEFIFDIFLVLVKK